MEQWNPQPFQVLEGSGSGHFCHGDYGPAAQSGSPSTARWSGAEEGSSPCSGVEVDGTGGVQGVVELFHPIPLHLPNSWQMLAQTLGCLGALVLIAGH